MNAENKQAEEKQVCGIWENGTHLMAEGDTNSRKVEFKKFKE